MIMEIENIRDIDIDIDMDLLRFGKKERGPISHL
jgi:hypothetical protein